MTHLKGIFFPILLSGLFSRRHSHYHLISQVSNILIKFETNIETVTIWCVCVFLTHRTMNKEDHQPNWKMNLLEEIPKKFMSFLGMFESRFFSSLPPSSFTILIWLSDFRCAALCWCGAIRLWIFTHFDSHDELRSECHSLRSPVEFGRQNNKRCHLYN